MNSPIAESLMPATPELGGAVAQPSDDARRLEIELARWFGVDFACADGRTGELLSPAPQLLALAEDWDWWRESILMVARRGSPGFLDEAGPLAVLAIPLTMTPETIWVAIGIVATRRAQPGERLEPAAQWLGIGESEAQEWINRQDEATPGLLLKLARMFSAKFTADRACRHLQDEADAFAFHLSSSNEEVNLLFRLTQNLKLSRSADELGSMTLDWLSDVLPAQSLVLQLLPPDDGATPNSAVGAVPPWHVRGACPLEPSEFAAMVESLGLGLQYPALVINPASERDHAWRYPGVRQLIITAISEGERLFGWLAAFNHRDDAEFGSLETDLLNSVGVILGAHAGNLELYRRERETLSGVVHSLTGLIEAKDKYTSGHSDRVATLALMIGRELGIDEKDLETLRFAGLLHDIGKIGIDDAVLNKPTKLTSEEFEHIKTHPAIGRRILSDLKQLDAVTPLVLHHHEQWNGQGYPQHLTGEEIPPLARIIAVADSFDAMRSDRPYRPGLPCEKIAKIFAAGAGQQWDTRVVAALFRALAKEPDGAENNCREDLVR